MIQLLPTGGFNWVDLSQLTSDKTDSYVNCNNEGYLLEVGIKYPKELHDLFMCENMKTNGVEKLVPDINDKKNYVVHIKVLNQALKHGLILEKVHRVIEFNKSAWLHRFQHPT